MASENDLSGKVALDTTAFKAGISDLNAQVKSIETSFRASAAVMGDWSNSTAGLQGRVDSLSEKLSLQKQKLSTLNEEYQKTVQAQGADSSAAQSLANQMYSTEKSINSTENDLKKYSTQLKDVKNKSDGLTFQKFNDGLAKTSDAASKALKGIAAFVGGAAAALGGLLGSSVKNADELQRLSDVTGFTAEQLQIMKYQGSALGVELDTMTGAQSKLIKAMNAASTGKSGPNAQAKAFQELGIQVRDSSGHLRDSNTVFDEAITKLSGVQNETDRDAIAMQIFGKSAMSLNPLIKAGGTELKNMADEAQNNGAIMSNEAVSGLDNFGDSIDAMKLSVQGLVGSAFGKLGPQLNDITAKIKGFDLSGVEKGLSFALDHLPQIGTAIAGVTGAIVTWKIAAVTANVIQGINNALTVTAAINTDGLAAGEAALAAAKGNTTLATMALSAATIKDTAQNIAHAAAQTASAVASKAAAAGQWLFTAALNANPIGIVITLIAALVAALVVLFNKNKTFHDWVLSAFSAIKNSAQSLVTTISGFFTVTIPNAFNSAKAKVTGIWNGLISGITSAWNVFKTYLSNPSLLFQAIQNAFSSAIDWIKDLPSEAIQWGRDIINGIVQGIKDAADAVGDAVKGVAQNIRKFLHFSVPDEGPLVDFQTWMPDFMAGLARGIEANKYKVVDAMRGLASDMSVSVPVSPAYAGGSPAPVYAYAASAAAPSIDYHPTYISPKALGSAETARQDRQNAQRIALIARRH